MLPSYKRSRSFIYPPKFGDSAVHHMILVVLTTIGRFQTSGKYGAHRRTSGTSYVLDDNRRERPREVLVGASVDRVLLRLRAVARSEERSGQLHPHCTQLHTAKLINFIRPTKQGFGLAPPLVLLANKHCCHARTCIRDIGFPNVYDGSTLSAASSSAQRQLSRD